MSDQALKWALKQKIGTGIIKVVLIKMAQESDYKFKFHCPLSRLMLISGVDKVDKLKNILKSLVEKNYITRCSNYLNHIVYKINVK